MKFDVADERHGRAVRAGACAPAGGRRSARRSRRRGSATFQAMRPRLPVEQQRRPLAAVRAGRPRSGRGARRPRATSSASSRSSPETISRSGGRVMRAGDLEQQRPDEVGDARSAPTGPRRGAGRSASTAMPGTPLTAAFSRVASTEARLPVAREHRVPAEPRRGDREHAAAAAPVGERAGRLELEQQLEAQPRGVVRAGAEGLPGSITRSMPSPAAARSHGGRTRSRRKRQPTSTGRWKAFQRSDQSSGTSEVETSTSASPAAARRSPAARAARPARRRARTRPRRRRPRAPPARRARARAARPAPPRRRRASTRTASRITGLQHDRRPVAVHAARRSRSASAERRRDLVGAVGEEPGRDRRAPAAAPSARGEQQLERQVRDHGRRPRRGRPARLGHIARDRDAVRGGVGADRLQRRRDRPRPRSRARSPAAPRRRRARRCPRPSRTARRRGSALEQQLEAELRGRVRAGAEQRARVDHEIARRRAARPRRANASAPAAATFTGRR